MRELREILQQLGLAAPGGQGAQNIADGEPSASHTRLAKADGWVNRDMAGLTEMRSSRSIHSVRAFVRDGSSVGLVGSNLREFQSVEGLLDDNWV